MYLTYSPFWLQSLYPSLTWHKSRDEKNLFLTFDDGPIPVVTPFVLNTLKKFDAKATFFCIGDNVAKHPDIFEQIIAEGHAVGNHTFNHLNGWKTDDLTYLQNIAQCDQLIISKLFRPPYGRATRSQYAIINTQYTTIMWDVLSGDFDLKLSPQECLNNVLKNTRNGSIILFHDSIKAWPRLETVLPQVLAHFRSKGYDFKSL
ncbi:MAG: polysaccharide deacetylase family protein [Daejeonella sp.]